MMYGENIYNDLIKGGFVIMSEKEYHENLNDVYEASINAIYDYLLAQQSDAVDNILRLLKESK